jgi:hypothetical protein
MGVILPRVALPAATKRKSRKNTRSINVEVTTKIATMTEARPDGVIKVTGEQEAGPGVGQVQGRVADGTEMNEAAEIGNTVARHLPIDRSTGQGVDLEAVRTGIIAE